MGELVTFPSNGQIASGYLARPPAGGPAVVVIQEWWGLVPHIEGICDRFAAEGFLAIAPDLYHGRKTSSPDEAGRLLMELDIERAGRDISGAGEFLLTQRMCASRTFGVVGFCMGGALAQYAGSKNSKVSAVVSFYGGFKRVDVPWAGLKGAALLIYGENDRGVPPEKGRELEQKLKAMGKRVETVVYPGAGHGFFNDERPEVYDARAAADAWSRTLNWFRDHIR